METTTVQPEVTMKTEPQKEHQWLQKLVGEWTFEGEAIMDTYQTTAKITETESVRTMGDH